MGILCTRCGNTVAVGDVNMDRLVARCVGCNTIFDVSMQIGGGGRGAAALAAPVQRQRAPVPLPSQFVLRVDDSVGLPEGGYRSDGRPPSARFSLAWRWFNAKYVFMAFFCVAWDSFLFHWYSNATSGGSIAFVFPIAHVAVGGWITYTTLAGFLNRTTIDVRDGVLSVSHHPIPWRGNHRLSTADIDQLYCREYVSATRNNQRSLSYGVLVLLKDQRTVKLLTGLPEADQALFIEQVIESRLGIVDVPVGGELASA